MPDNYINRPLHVGLAGFGIVGNKRYKFLEASDKFMVVAICEKRTTLHDPSLAGISWFKDYQTMMNEDLDVVFVCLSNDMSAKVSIASLDKGFHTFCEKPPARNVAEMIQVREVEDKAKGLKLKYGFNHRYHDSVRAALDIVNENSMGKVINIRGVYGKSNLITFDQTDWRTSRDIAGGGILLDQGIHMVDLIRLFGGNFTDIHSFVSNDYWKYDVEDNVYALMKSEEGVVAMLHSSATQWKHKFQLEIDLEDGMLNLSGILSGSQSYGEETLTITPANSGVALASPESVAQYKEDNSWRDEISDFGDDIKLDRPVSTGNSSDALETMVIIGRIYEADLVWKKQWGL